MDHRHTDVQLLRVRVRQRVGYIVPACAFQEHAVHVCAVRRARVDIGCIESKAVVDNEILCGEEGGRQAEDNSIVMVRNTIIQVSYTGRNFLLEYRQRGLWRLHRQINETSAAQQDPSAFDLSLTVYVRSKSYRWAADAFARSSATCPW